MPKNLTFTTLYYKLDICDKMLAVTRRAQYVGGIALNDTFKPNIFTVENDTLVVRDYHDRECKNFHKELLRVPLGTVRISDFLNEKSILDDAIGYEVISVVPNEPEYPQVEEGEDPYFLHMTYGFTGDDSICQGETTQELWIESNVCARNWVVWGSWDLMNDVIKGACNEELMYVMITQSVDCSDRIVIFEIEMDKVRLLELVGQKFCFFQPGAERYVTPKCVRGLPERAQEFKSEGSFSKLDFYYANNHSKCLGTPTLSMESVLDKCSGNQKINANSTHYAIRVYDHDDYDCERKPTTIHFYDLSLLGMLEDDPKCSNMWIYKLDNYFKKISFYNDYDLQATQSSVAMINNIDCENPDYDYIKKYQYSAYRSFFLIKDDFCVSTHSLFQFHLTNQISFKGDCRDGQLFMRNYSFSPECEGTFFHVPGNGFCLETTYFLCLSYYCYEISMHDDEVCGGNGECIFFDTCECDKGYTGKNCSLIASPSLVWMFPVFGSVAGIAILILLLSAIIVAIILFQILRQKKKLQDFSEIEDIQLLLEESKIEKKEGLNDLQKTNKKLFNLANKSFALDWKKIILKKEIGCGGSGAKVYLSLWGNKQVAYKVFKTTYFSDSKNYDDFAKELEFAISLRHPNILEFYGSTIQLPNRIGIVMEFCGKGSIKSYFRMQKLKKKPIKLEEKLRIMLEIASAMKYLKDRKIIHRDLKSDNVLLTESLTAKVMDFGLSKKVGNEFLEMTQRVGTSYYMAPEVNYSKQYTYKVDMFSFGITAWEIFYNNFNPYAISNAGRSNLGSLELVVMKNEEFRPIIEPEDEKKHPNFFKMIKNCWDNSPDVRPEWESIISTITNLRNEILKTTVKIEPKKIFSNALKDKEQQIKDLKMKLKKLERKYKFIEKEKNKEISKLKKRANNMK